MKSETDTRGDGPYPYCACGSPISQMESVMSGSCEECLALNDDPEERDCYWCAGEGWTECDDPIQCTSPHNSLGECQCGSCGGTGNAKDMTIW